MYNKPRKGCLIIEREFFKDRPETVQFNENLYKGRVVFICLKKMQPFAKNISDLTLTRITQNLTKQYKHPRGQKIRGEKIELDKFGNMLVVNDFEEVVGRCTYILDDNGWSLDTNEGKKVLIYNNKKDELDLISVEKLTGFLKIYVLLSAGKVSFKIPFCKFTYFRDDDIARNFLDKTVLTNAIFKNDKIIMNFNGTNIYEDNIELFFDNVPSYEKNELLDYLRYTQKARTTAFNEEFFELELKSFFLEKIL